jgi:glycosyltransferase involved in cell wall biosynthesis
LESAGKALIIVQNLPVPFDRRVWLESQTLREAGFQVSVISPADTKGKYPPGHVVIDDIHVYRYPAPPEAQSALGFMIEFIYCWLWTAVLTVRVFFTRGFDVIHACNPPETFFLLALPFKLFGRRFLFDHHDLSPEMYVAKGGRAGSVLHRGLLLLEQATFRTADVVVTTNRSHKEIAMRRGGVAEERIFIVRSGPDFERLTLLPPEPALKQGRPFLVCYLGEMCKQDGVDYLLRSIRLLIDRGRRDISFVLMGGGPELAELRRLCDELCLTEWVTMTGRVSDQDLCRYLSTADLCVDPDPYTEWADQSTMNKIMEYMAFGKPVVAFDLKEHHYSAQTAAVYAPPNDIAAFADLIETLLADPERRFAMGQFGLERVRNALAWDYSKPVLREAYQAVLRRAK